MRGKNVKPGSAPAAKENSWEEEVGEIAARKQAALAMGGPDRVAKQHQRGKLDVRQRIRLLCDGGEFEEIGALAGTADPESGELGSRFVPSNVIIGVVRGSAGKFAINADDFTVGNGAPDETGSAKRTFIERYACEMRIPLVRLVDMAGASLRQLENLGYTSIPGPKDWDWLRPLNEVPVVAVACGPAPGLGAWRVAASHFSIQVDGIGHVFAAGPPIVAAGMGEHVTADELGGASVHARHSGVVDNVAATEEEAFEQVRRFLSYLPPSVHALPRRSATTDDPERRDEFLLSIIPRNVRTVYDVRKLLTGIFDVGSIFEIGRGWGRSSVVGFARLNGYPVGFLANDPKYYGGGMDEFAAEKIARHVDLCDTFHLPIVNVVDQPGTVIGVQAERRGTVRKGLRALAAVDQSRVPWFAVVVRRLFGLGGATYGPTRRLNNRIAWPSARWGALPIEGGVDALYKRDIESAPDPQARRQELERRLAAVGSPLRTAERFGINDVIDPRDTRSVLCRWVADAYETLEPGTTMRGLRP